MSRNMSKGYIEATLPNAPARAVSGLYASSSAPTSTQATSRHSAPTMLSAERAAPIPAVKSRASSIPHGSNYDGVNASLTQTMDLIASMKLKSFQESQRLRQSFRSSSMATNVKPKPSSSVPSIPSTHKQVQKQVNSVFQARLQQQLAGLNLLADQVRSTYSRESRAPVLLSKTLCSRFTVGRLYSVNSSNVEVYEDRLEYYFQHHDKGKIHMIMYFKDMSSTTLDIRKLTLKFRIGRELLQFGSDFDPQQHELSVQFGSRQEIADFEKLIETFVPITVLR